MGPIKQDKTRIRPHLLSTYYVPRTVLAVFMDIRGSEEHAQLQKNTKVLGD